MRNRLTLFLLALLVVAPSFAHAQDFGIVESAETINQGNFKLRFNPILTFGKGQDSHSGVAVVAGYGFTHSFDMEGGVALYDGVRIFGANGEFWLVKRDPFDVSIAAGLHATRGNKTVDATGVDLTFLPSKHLSPKLDVYGGLDFAFESISDKFGGGSFKTVHFVPGIEYGLGPDLDFVAEIGFGLNHYASHYFSGGLAYYFR